MVGKPVGSGEAVTAILAGTEKPTVFSPASGAYITLLDQSWQLSHPKRLTRPGEPLVLSPIVIAMWKPMAEALGWPGKPIGWRDILDVSTNPKGWGAFGRPEWGEMKLGHTDPNRSNSGMQAIVLMAYEFFNITTGLTVEHMLDPKFQEFVKQIEDGVPHFEASTGTFMTEMIRFGPSKYDIALVYESLAISQLENAQGRWGSLHIYYPPTTIWSDHPVVVLNGAWITPAQHAAADKLVAFLRSTPVQATALRFGFRPADPSVPMKSTEEQNPFVKMSQYGLSLELPPATRPPDGPVIRNLLMMWSRVVKPK